MRKNDLFLYDYENLKKLKKQSFNRGTICGSVITCVTTIWMLYVAGKFMERDRDQNVDAVESTESE